MTKALALVIWTHDDKSSALLVGTCRGEAQWYHYGAHLRFVGTFGVHFYSKYIIKAYSHIEAIYLGYRKPPSPAPSENDLLYEVTQVNPLASDRTAAGEPKTACRHAVIGTFAGAVGSDEGRVPRDPHRSCQGGAGDGGDRHDRYGRVVMTTRLGD